MPKQPQRLRMQSIDRVALVDKGDNPAAHVVIHKRAPQVAKTEALTFAQAIAVRNVNEDLWQYTAALESSIRNVLESDEADKTALISESLDQFTAAMKGALPGWVGVTKGDPMEKTERIGIAQKILKALGLGDEEITIPDNKETPVTTKIEPAPAPAAPAAPAAPVEKSADVIALEKRIEAQDAELQKMREKAENAEFVAKANGWQALPTVTADEFGPILRKISGALTPEEFGKVEKMLAAANEAIRTGDVFKEVGSEGDAAEGSVEAEVKAAVQKRMEADKSLTEVQARAKVWREMPDLYERYEDERAERAGAR